MAPSLPSPLPHVPFSAFLARLTKLCPVPRRPPFFFCNPRSSPSNFTCRLQILLDLPLRVAPPRDPLFFFTIYFPTAFYWISIWKLFFVFPTACRRRCSRPFICSITFFSVVLERFCGSADSPDKVLRTFNFASFPGICLLASRSGLGRNHACSSFQSYGPLRAFFLFLPFCAVVRLMEPVKNASILFHSSRCFFFFFFSLFSFFRVFFYAGL